MDNITKLYTLLNFKELNISLIKKMASFMPKKRLEKYNRLQPIEKKINCVLAYYILLYALKKNFFFDKPPIISNKENGKPYLKSFKNVFFNISHAKNAIICGISKQEIGVDIEYIRTVDPCLAKNILTHLEMLYFSKCKNKNEFFFKVWTKKESYCKKKDMSIFNNFKKLESFYLKNTKSFKYKNYVFSVSSKKYTHFKIFDITSLKDIFYFNNFIR